MRRVRWQLDMGENGRVVAGMARQLALSRRD